MPPDRRRGELRLSVPFGYIWHREAGLGLDPDLRLQDVIRCIFARFHELGSARQVLLSMTKDQIYSTKVAPASSKQSENSARRATMREDQTKFLLHRRNRRRLHLDQIRPHRLGVGEAPEALRNLSQPYQFHSR
jgi:hypothetical protein